MGMLWSKLLRHYTKALIGFCIWFDSKTWFWLGSNENNKHSTFLPSFPICSAHCALITPWLNSDMFCNDTVCFLTLLFSSCEHHLVLKHFSTSRQVSWSMKLWLCINNTPVTCEVTIKRWSHGLSKIIGKEKCFCLLCQVQNRASFKIFFSPTKVKTNSVNLYL